jgi:hypothetical protein
VYRNDYERKINNKCADRIIRKEEDKEMMIKKSMKEHILTMTIRFIESLQEGK